MADGPSRVGGVRLRTTLGATAVVALALVAGGLVLVGTLRASLTNDVQVAAEVRALDVVALLEAGEPTGSLAVAELDESFVQVLDSGGDVVAASSNVSGQDPVAALAPGESVTLPSVLPGEDGSFRVVARGTRSETFVVIVGRSLEPVDESTSVVTAGLLAGVPALAVLVAGTTWLVTGRALRPVEAIRREVAAISATELRRRVPEPGGDDEVARLARTMNAMLDRLEAARDRQRRFVSDASHELRSPIATIRHRLEVALAQPGSTVEDLAPDLLAEDLRMSRLVDDLLLLARADEDTLTIRRRPVDLDDLVLAEAGRLRAHGRVRVDTTGVAAGRVLGDRAHLGRLVRNLVDNAERHASSQVGLALRTTAGHVVLEVVDDGGGVAPDDRHRIFERFTRLDDARARDSGGAGLGLSIVDEVANVHGGTVRVEGDHGARFVVVLPAHDDS